MPEDLHGFRGNKIELNRVEIAALDGEYMQ